MEREKNPHASIPHAPLADAQRFAEAEHIAVNEPVRDAMERRRGEGYAGCDIT